MTVYLARIFGVVTAGPWHTAIQVSRAGAFELEGMNITLIRTLIVGITAKAISPKTWAASWNDDSHCVSLGPQDKYYMVRPDSQLFRNSISMAPLR